MAKTKHRLHVHSGFEISNDAQRAKAEAMARKGWHDDEDIVVDPEFAKRLRAAIEQLRRRVDVPTELLYKTVIRARLAPARHKFNKKGAMIEKALVAARALCNAVEGLGSPPDVYWAHHRDVGLFRKVIGELPSLYRLRDDLDAVAAQFKNFKSGIGRPRDSEKASFQLLMVSFLPDRVRQSGQRMDKEFSKLYEMVSGRKQNSESYNRMRRATTAHAAKILCTIGQ